MGKPMKIIKRNGEEVIFDAQKIVKAIKGANKEVPLTEQLSEETIQKISENIEKKCEEENHEMNVEAIQDLVEDEIMKASAFTVAKKYITYRYQHALNRKANSTDDQIMSLIECQNEEVKQENSNKNSTVVSVQRDYMAGEVSKDITKRFLLTPEIVEAHNEGIIHFHDADYFAQHMHNCLARETRFITDKGVKSFEDFSDGERITVLTKDGAWKGATVKKYGTQKLFKFTFYNGKKEITKEVLATEDHRWYLQDGTVTTALKEGDNHIKAPKIYDQDADYEKFTNEQKLLWCKGFALGDGTVEYEGAGKQNNSTRIRLCGEKDNKWLERFDIEGCKVREQVFENGDRSAVVYDYHKEIPEFNNPDDVRAFFNGLYCADGKMAINNPESRTYRIQSSDEKTIDFIRKFAPTAGLYITAENDLTGEVTNFTGEEGRKHTILFSFNPDFSFSYTVLSKEFAREDEVWCLEVDEEKNFVLANGIVTGNCDLVNLEDMLQNGTVISGTKIDKPHSFSTACNIATQIIAQVASSQYGGQSISLTHLVPFVEISRQKFRKELKKIEEISGIKYTEEQIDEIVEMRVKEEINRGVQIIQYQVVTLMTTNGQSPFITVFMYLNETKNEREKADLAMIIEEVLNQRYKGVKNESGYWVAPAFPKLIYVLEEDNITPGSKYYYLTELAAKCTSRRLVPDYISEKKMKELKGDVYTCMGCRSFLTPDRFTEAGVGNVANAGNYEPGKHKYYGRFNQGVVTINLVDVACSSGGDMDAFWRIFDERLELCHRALMLRHQRLLGTPSDVAPILWQNGALARLNKGETIDKLLFNGYSTISLGYAGLCECVKYMTGKSHTDPSATPFAIEVMKKMNEKCAGWKKESNIDFSLYGTPLESTTYKFAKCLKKRFGEIEGVTDKNYITNSYHVHVTEPIDAFTKLSFESQFQELSPGGAVSYVEVPNMENNIPAVMALLKHIYDNIMYAELNTKSDCCQKCGYTGEIRIVTDSENKLVWKCPNCGNTDQSTMNVARRTCGYIGTQYWNQGRTQEIKERVLHL